MAAELTVIAAVAENGVIGSAGGIPWEGYGSDMEHFEEQTTGHPVIMGRVTYESIKRRNGGPLPGRTNVIISESMHYSGKDRRTVRSPGSALSLALTLDDSAFIIGGESVYRALLPQATHMLLTRIPEKPEGDRYFPDFDEESWELCSTEPLGDAKLCEWRRDAVSY